MGMISLARILEGPASLVRRVRCGALPTTSRTCPFCFRSKATASSSTGSPCFPSDGRAGALAEAGLGIAQLDLPPSSGPTAAQGILPLNLLCRSVPPALPLLQLNNKAKTRFSFQTERCSK